MANVIPPFNPNLPQAPDKYSRVSQEQHNNVLRLYFTQLTSAFRAVVGKAGGQHVDCPYGLFFSMVDHTLAAVNTGYPVEFENTYLSNTVTRTSASRITCDVDGVYNFQFSGQLISTDASSKTAYIWLRRSGTNIGYSTHAYTISGTGTKQEISWNFDIDMMSGQYLEIVFAGDSLGMKLGATAATAPHPGIASAVITVNFIAPLPVPLPTPP